MKKEILIFFIALMTWPVHLAAQDRAPSCWLHYKDGFPGDILVNTVRVQAPSPTYTYYCNLQWNAGMEAGGYCGIQEHPEGRNFIYSIWDPISSNEAIIAAYLHDRTEVENFGGEGTGLKSWNFGIGWETGRWYSFITRAWDRDDHTMFGYWVFDHFDSVWHHLVTMDFPVANARFNSATGSFIEDWMGNGWETRSIHQNKGWKRKVSDGSWIPLNEAVFTRVENDEGAINYMQSYDGGVAEDYYFMKSGGPVFPLTNQTGAMLAVQTQETEPQFIQISIDTFFIEHTTDSLFIQWDSDPAALPQFAYEIQIFGNSQYAGTPMISITGWEAQRDSITIPLNELPMDANYYYRFRITDIFDNSTDDIEGTFRRESAAAAVDMQHDRGTLVYPNPATGRFRIDRAFAGGSYTICALQGNIVQTGRLTGRCEINLSDCNPGLYLLELRIPRFRSTELLILE